MVDDDEDYAQFVKRLLARGGTVGPLDVAHNERQAFEALERNQYDIVVSDLDLRGGTGVRVLEQVRQRSPQAQRILLTSAPEQAERQLVSRDSLAHQVWDKRWELGTIRDRLRSLLRFQPTP